VNIFVCPSADETGKFRGIVQAFPGVWDGRVLDVGSRSGNLKRVLPKGVYYGLDLYPPADIIANSGAGLPFREASFETVVALDVLEHTDNIYEAFQELCRVAREYVLITLPNVFEISSRLRFLFGTHCSAKYGLPVDPPADRHRWFFSFQEAMAFTHAWAHRCGFAVTADGCLIGPRRGAAAGRFALGRFPNLLSPSYLALLSRRGEREVSKV
jgi:SAM-dependent methyltransferase